MALTAALVVTGLVAAPAHATGTRTISGVVTGPDGEPVQEFNATLVRLDGSLWGWEVTGGWQTDGAYALEVEDPGVYTLRFEADGVGAPRQYLGGRLTALDATTFTVTDHDVELDVRLTAGGTISGTVRDEQGQPVPDAEVSALALLPDDEQHRHGYALTDSAGRYTIDGVLPGTWLVEAYAPGPYLPVLHGSPDAPAPFTMSPEQTRTGVDVVLPFGGTLSGVVRGEDGSLRTEAVVTLYRFRKDGWGFTVVEYVDHVETDTEGYFRFSRLDDGEYTLHVYDEGPRPRYRPQFLGGVTDVGGAERFTVRRGQAVSKNVRLRLDPYVAAGLVEVRVPERTRRYGTAGRVEVRVTSLAGDPQGSVTLKDGGRTIGTARLVRGRTAFTLPADLAVGEHRLTARFSSTGDVQPGTSKVTVLTVTKARPTLRTTVLRAKKQVRVLARAGSLPAPGRVVLKSGRKKVDAARLRQGRARLSFAGLPAGRHRLRVVHAGSPVTEAGSRTVRVKAAA